jgi:hypothetical protein
MNAAPGGELRAAGGLWGPPARALREMLGRRFPKRHRPTWLSPGADQENPVPIRLLVAGWLSFRVAAPRLSPATTWGPSPANLVVANRPRGLTRDNCSPQSRSAGRCWPAPPQNAAGCSAAGAWPPPQRAPPPPRSAPAGQRHSIRAPGARTASGTRCTSLLLQTAVQAAGERPSSPMDGESGAGFGCLRLGAHPWR